MAITFTVAQKKIPDNVIEATFASTLKSWLDSLSVTTVYGLEIEHLQGFWIVTVIYA